MVGDWLLVAVGSGWQLAVGRRWRLAAVGGWRLVVGGWWRLAVDGSWRLAVGGPLGRSLRAVLCKTKKIWSLKDHPDRHRFGDGGWNETRALHKGGSLRNNKRKRERNHVIQAEQRQWAGSVQGMGMEGSKLERGASALLKGWEAGGVWREFRALAWGCRQRIGARKRAWAWHQRVPAIAIGLVA